MTEVQQLGQFVAGTQFSQLGELAREQLKIRVLDTINVAIGALEAQLTQVIRRLTGRLGGDASRTRRPSPTQ